MKPRSSRLKLIPLFAALFAAPSAFASVDLIAIGSLSGLQEDLSLRTAAPLENGVPGNHLGGLGSGIGYAGDNTFVAVPDRGPNAVSYNSAVDDTASYIDRLQTFRMRLSPSAAGAALPYVLSPYLSATTLLSSPTPLVYGDGVAAGIPDGAPALNATDGVYYLTGRSDNFDPALPSTNPNNGRFDPESVRISPAGTLAYVSDEYGPFVYVFSRKTGQRVKTYTLPAKFAVTNLSPNSATEISGNTAGRIANKGMEGLAISPDGKTLFGILQSPLIQDKGTDGAYTRIVAITVSSGKTVEYVYPLTNIGTPSKPKYPTVSDIVAINDHEFLVDERDGKGLGDNSTAAFKRLFRINLAGAADASNVIGEANLAPLAVAKTPFLDLVTAFNAAGIASSDIPAKLEGLAFGDDLSVNGTAKHTLWVTNDNDYIGTVTDSNHPNGIDNANKFFVFTVDSTDLPTYVPQVIKVQKALEQF